MADGFWPCKKWKIAELHVSFTIGTGSDEKLTIARLLNVTNVLVGQLQDSRDRLAE